MVWRRVGVVVAAAVLAAGVPAVARADSFSRPPATVRAKFRWWWPAATVSRAEVAREIDEIADAGFGGVEIADVYDSVSQPIDPAQYGWGGARWNAAVETALREARRRGLEVDLTIGPHWPSAVPGVQPDDLGAAKELAFGDATVAGGDTFDAVLPPPNTKPGGATAFNPDPPTTPRLVAVQAARCATDCSGSPVALDQSSLVDLTSRVHGGRLTWTAPAGGRWVLISYWQRGTGQLERMFDFAAPGSRLPLTDPQGYVVDHFGRAGAQAVIDYWDGHLLTPTIRSLLRAVHGEIFEDSLELNSVRYWTPDLPAQFERRRGYSLRPYLPVVLGQSTPAFTFSDDVTTRVRHDYDQTLSDLYLDNRVKPLKAWLNSMGLRFRNQPYGAPIDGPQAAATTDVPEGESLGFGDALDRFRALAAGRDMGGRKLLSDEAGAFFGGAYDVTWQQMLATLNSISAAGVNQAMIHGFPYTDAPGAQWPGFHAFFPLFLPGGFGEAWGPRQPTWAQVPDVSGYLARTQDVLQRGVDRVDVAIFHGQLDVGAGTGDFFADPGLAQAGYSYGFLSPGVLDGRSAFVAGGRLAPFGPAYKAFVIDAQPTMPLATARRLLGFARAGLPVVVVGDPPAATPGFRDAASEDAALRVVMAQLLAQPRTRHVAAEADVPAALAALGVQPAAANGSAVPVLNVHRSAPGAEYYFLYDHGDAGVDEEVTLTGRGTPYVLDAWTGRVRPVGTYRRTGDRVTLRLRLAGEDATIVALAHGRPWFGAPHVVSTTADDAFVRRGRVIVRATAPGTYAATLSDGRTVRATLGGLPAAEGVTRWHLSAEDWRPGATATTTVEVRHELDLAALAPWPDIPELRDAAGVGRYTATVDLPAGWRRAVLDLGQVYDTFRVTVNGRRLPPLDQMQTTVDLGRRLHPGTNTIEVVEATTLNNRMRVLYPDLLGSRPQRPYGLVGPVVLRPYGQVRVRLR